MKYLGKVSDPKDLATKKYVDDFFSTVVESSTPPEDHDVFWKNGNRIYYYDYDFSEWFTWMILGGS